MRDETEATRRAMIANREPELALEADDGPRWTTEELVRDFVVLGFLAPFVVVRRKSDDVRGSLVFTDKPRIYFGWKADE